MQGSARLELVARLVSEGAAGDPEAAEIAAAAYARARSVADTLDGDPQAERLASTILVAGSLTGTWIAGRNGRDVRDLVERAAGLIEAPPEAFALGVSMYTLCDPTLLELPPGLAIRAQLELLCALACLDGVSLWAKGGTGAPTVVGHAGDAPRSRHARSLAAAALSGDTSAGRELHAQPVMRWQRPYAALVGRLPASHRKTAPSFLEQAAAMLGPVLEREWLLERSAARERTLVKASERRLTRLGFDLHDEPLQEVAALAAEVAHFRRQLTKLPGNGFDQRRLVGRVADIEARLQSLGGSLRAICHSLEGPGVLARPLRELIEREVAGFRARTDIGVELSMKGDLDVLTDSQRIALVRIAQECLSNVREHSGATQAAVEIEAGRSAITARVTDDGRGFDVDSTLVQSARRGRLGLIGIHERARLLGGSCDVHSKPGGPTAVVATLPRWDGVADAASRSATVLELG